MKSHGLRVAIVLVAGLAACLFTAAACTSFSTESVADDAGAESGPAPPADAEVPGDGAPADAADASPRLDASAPDGSDGALYVFVSSEQRPGTMGAGGRPAADAWCAALANKVPSLAGRTWVAWLSMGTTGTGARARLPAVLPEYRLVNGTRVLAAGVPSAQKLEHPIDRDESAMLVDSTSPVWTGTSADGLLSPLGNCSDWTTTTGLAATGDPTFTDFGWTAKSPQSCGMPARVYCFEIPKPPQ